MLSRALRDLALTARRKAVSELVSLHCWNAIDPGWDVDEVGDLNIDQARQNRKALSFLWKHVEIEFMEDIGSCTFAKDAWENLKAILTTYTLTQCLRIMKDMFNTIKTPEVRMQKYMSELQGMNRIVQTAGYGLELNDKQLAGLFLAGLPEERYKVTIAIVGSDKNLTTKKVKAAFLQEDPVDDYCKNREALASSSNYHREEKESEKKKEEVADKSKEEKKNEDVEDKSKEEKKNEEVENKTKDLETEEEQVVTEEEFFGRKVSQSSEEDYKSAISEEVEEFIEEMNQAEEDQQKNAIEDLVVEFKYQKANSRAAPLMVNSDDKTEASQQDFDRERYQSAVGKLMYLSTCTRPDICYACSVVSQFNKAPKNKNWNDVTHIVRYLKGTSEMKLTFSKDEPKIEIYCDADFNKEKGERLSRSGYIIKMAGGAVSWYSKKQTFTAMSTAEAEYYAMSEAVKEVLWLRMFLKELQLHSWVKNATKIKCDNQSAMKFAENGLDSENSKHIDIRYCFVEQCVKREEVEFEYVKSAENLADLFTKALSGIKTEYFVGMLGLKSHDFTKC
ncbi:hypothetical protein FOCC_FOCC000736 [Frankliniella occidentalis]|nr:hypothetical protein FOCC_FOCC000736 [Frankliniella occidentalis]